MKKTEELRFLIKSISVYKDVSEDKVLKNIAKILKRKLPSAEKAAEIYSEIFECLLEKTKNLSLSEYVYEKVLYSENPFTLECAKGNFSLLNSHLLNAVKNELSVFETAAGLKPKDIKDHLIKIFPEFESLIESLPSFSDKHFEEFKDWGESIEKFAEFAKENGYGRFGRHRTFFLNETQGRVNLSPVLNPDNISLENLKDYEIQQEIIKENTLAFLNGQKANNILLYGDSGTGKSSTVKAIVNEYHKKGLRLVEVSKENIKNIGKIISFLSKVPMKFIIFIDDLTFTDGDDNYAAMKAILEGSSNKIASNMLIYATSNRRHLVQETFTARKGDEIHLSDTIDELTSLSDRFGITVTFIAPTYGGYISIVKSLAKDNGINLPEDQLEKGANQWSLEKSSMSPRTAQQYIDYLKSKEAGKNA